MCSGQDSRPPIEPTERPARGQHRRISAPDGSSFDAYEAPAVEASGAGIVVLPDYGGLGPFYEELTLRFAEHGVDALAIDYYGRTASPPPRDPEAFDHVAHARRTTWRELAIDAQAAVAHLRRSRPLRAVFTIGFCFGGRESFLLGGLAELDLAGVIGFYGWPVGDFLNDMPAPAGTATGLVAPLLGLFGGADPRIPRSDVEVFEEALRRAGVEHRVVTYPGAPHSFFDRRAAEHHEAAEQAWGEVLAFIAAHSR